MSHYLALAGVGAFIGAGGWALVLAGLQSPPRLADALDLLAGRSADPLGQAAGMDRLGRWLRARLRHPASPTLRRRLRLAGRGLDRHYAYKVMAGLVGFAVPTVFAMVMLWVAGVNPGLPAALGLLLGVTGFLLPDWLLRGAEQRLGADAAESLLTFFDLVTLERLANASASQALRSAASLSDVPVFLDVREALERARLEQCPPFAGLRTLSAELDLPALADVSDVMAMEDSGASLSNALRARVKELRDAHLTQARIAAAAVSERMAVLMVVPSLVFGLFFLTPPVIRLVGA